MAKSEGSAELVKPAELARRLGVSRQAVSKAIKTGRIQTVSGGLVEFERALASWRGNSHPIEGLKAAGRSAPPPSVPLAEGPEDLSSSSSASSTFATSRAIREAYLARLARLDYEERVGKLLPADEVRKTAFQAARRARDLLLAVPDRLSAVLAASTDPGEVRNLLTEEIQRAVNELARQPLAG